MWLYQRCRCRRAQKTNEASLTFKAPPWASDVVFPSPAKPHGGFIALSLHQPTMFKHNIIILVKESWETYSLTHMPTCMMHVLHAHRYMIWLFLDAKVMGVWVNSKKVHLHRWGWAHSREFPQWSQERKTESHNLHPITSPDQNLTTSYCKSQWDDARIFCQLD